MFNRALINLAKSYSTLFMYINFTHMRRSILIFSALMVLLLCQCKTADIGTQQKTAEVKNVILMIGDGMGVSQVYAGMTANHGTLHLERCQYAGFSKTYAANNYITDSAAGGTAIACGVKTNNGTIGMDASDRPVKSILELAGAKGLSTGVIATYELTNATPASFVAHQPKRSMEYEIAMDYLNSDVTLCIGGGRQRFEQRPDSLNLTAQMKNKGYRVAYTMDELSKIKSGKLLGLLADGHMPSYPERGEMLPEAVKIALGILDNNSKGFFLMVESSQIDGGGHANNTDKIVNEMLDFDRTIKEVFDFAEKNSGTLVIITADHETGGLAINGGNLETGEVKGEYTTKGHTGVMVPVFSFGAGAEEFAGIYENTDIMPKILKLLNR